MTAPALTPEDVLRALETVVDEASVVATELQQVIRERVNTNGGNR